MIRYKYQVDGENPLEKLEPLAYSVVQDGGIHINREDAKRIAKLSPSKVRELSRKIASGRYMTTSSCLDEVEGMSAKTDTNKSLVDREDASELEHLVDRYCEVDPREWIKEFGILHGWEDTIDLNEVVQAWKEFKLAWETFRDEAKEVSGVSGWKPSKNISR
ncbi:MAG: hypothetical protein CMK32_10230 [Porticoccaceae bacterium]|nr:hypothetical protein [Porticoccaceae bacterium]